MLCETGEKNTLREISSEVGTARGFDRGRWKLPLADAEFG